MLVKIDKIDNFGKGIARLKDKIVFVKGAYPGETVEINIIKEKKKYIEAEVSKIIDKASYRIETNSPYLYSGFNYLNITREKELEFKKQIIKELFSKYTENIQNIYTDGNLKYRNKVRIFKKGNKVGILKENSNDILPVENLEFVDERINEEYQKNKNTKFNKLMLRAGDKVIATFDEKFSDQYIYEFVLGNKFKIAEKSFFQINKNVSEKMYEYVKEHLDKEDKVLDLYSGIGSIGISVSDKVKKVLSIEINKSSYLDSLENIKLNNIKNVESINNDVLKESERFKEYNIAIVDPPRKGLDKRLIDVLDTEKIIYISCNPITLKRDIELLKDKYIVKVIKPFDMFPRTYHMEIVVLMIRV